MGEDRGQSSVISIVLLLGITMTAVALTVGLGAVALTNSKADADLGRTEQALTQFDSRASLVALGEQDSQTVSVNPLGSDSTTTIEPDAGWMNVTIFNETSGAVKTIVMNESMGALVYERSESSIAYQGGGVWRKRGGNGSTMVSPPEFHYRVRAGDRPTLTLPLVTIDSEDKRVRRSVTIEANGTEAKYPEVGNSDRSNPLDGGQIEVLVHSEYYQAWGRFFEDRTGGTVTYKDDKQIVKIILEVPPSGPNKVAGGIVSGGTSGATLTIPQNIEADSYNSSNGPYSVTETDNTSVVASNDVTLENKAVLDGNLEAGGTVTLNNNAEVTGNVSYGGTLSNDGTIGGTATNDADVDIPDAVDTLIDDKRETFNDSNDNAGATDIDASTEQLQNCGSTCELPAGDYILDSISLGSGDELELNTTNGEVEIVVRNDVTLDADEVNVTGGGKARFYLEGDLDVPGSDVIVPDDRAPALWFYMNPGSQATIDGNAQFVGVIYGPGSGAQEGVEITIRNNPDVFGGVVGKVDNVGNNMGLHFDEALTKEDPLAPGSSDLAQISYLHVSVNRVNVSGSG